MSMNIRAVIVIHDAVNCLWSRTFKSVKSDVPTSTATTAMRSQSRSVRYFKSGGHVAFLENAFLIHAIDARQTKWLTNYLQSTRISSVLAFAGALLPVDSMNTTTFSLNSSVTSSSLLAFHSLLSDSSWSSFSQTSSVSFISLSAFFPVASFLSWQTVSSWQSVMPRNSGYPRKSGTDTGRTLKKEFVITFDNEIKSEKLLYRYLFWLRRICLDCSDT